MPEGVYWTVFDSHSVAIKTMRTKRSTMRLAKKHEGWTVGKMSYQQIREKYTNGRILQLFNNNGCAMTFISHGGEHGEWR